MPDVVSILIPVYNARPWVARAIESALAQTWPNKEIIVLDDGSTDGSMAAIAPYRGRVQIKSATNGGQNVSRNRLTALSRGEWLFYLDADDELAPDSVERKMKVCAGAAVVYGSMDLVTIKEGQNVISEKKVAQDYDDPWVAAFGWKFPNTSACAFQRKALLDTGGWDETVQNGTDYALYFPLLLRGGRFKAAPDAWSLYRQWSTTQAVNVAPMRLMVTRLRLMRNAAAALKMVGGLAPEREQAFLDSSLAVIRTIYPVDARLAHQEHRKLLDWNRSFHPSAGVFPTNYRLAYNTLGFRAAEFLAARARQFKSKQAAC